MTRAQRGAVGRLAAALGLALLISAPAPGQTVLYNSNGFDTGYNLGNIVGQQSFQGEPVFASAGTVQTQVKLSGTNAFQIAGPSLFNNTPFQGGNFWYRSSSFATGYNPVGSGTPFVQILYHSRASGAIPLNNDIPFAGIYLEGYTAAGQQQALTPIFVNLNGGVTVFTNSATGGSTSSVSTDNNLLPREDWNKLYAELNFNTQTFRVYKHNNTTPLVFHAIGSDIVDVPFRNTLGPTQRIAEIGMLGFYNYDPFSGAPVQPLNNFFIDDYLVTATATSQPPIPEPGLALAAGAAGLIGLRFYRRRRAAKAA